MSFKAGLVAVLLLAHSAWAQERSTGSLVPCAVPLQWRLGELDTRFGLGPAEALAAVEDAAGLWEDAMGRELFAHDPTRGFAIDFEFDDR